MTKKLPEYEALSKMPDDLSRYLEHMEADARAALEELFQTALQQARTLEVFDLWEEPELAVTYWTLSCPA